MFLQIDGRILEWKRMNFGAHQGSIINIEERRHYSAILLSQPITGVRRGEAHGKVPDHTITHGVRHLYGNICARFRVYITSQEPNRVTTKDMHSPHTWQYVGDPSMANNVESGSIERADRLCIYKSTFLRLKY